MGSFAANNITTWCAGFDLTGFSNQTTLNMEYEALDSNVYQPASNTTPAHTRVAGLEDVQLSDQGFWESGAGLLDPTAFTALGGVSQPITNSHDGAEQSPAYIYRARQYNYDLGGQLGELMGFQLTAQAARGTGLASVGAIRGRVLKTKANVTGTGATGTAFQLGAVGSGQYLYATFHVFAVGTTITAVLESDNASNFPSATTQMTFGPITTVGGTWGTRVAGPITDDWYRLRITAVTGTFSIACAAGFR